MRSLFVPADRDSLALRLAELEPATARHWGTMDPAQMLCHCARGLEAGMSDRPVKQIFLGKLVMPFIRGRVFGDRPFRRNTPTAPFLVVADPCAFDAERARLANAIDRFVQRGPAVAAKATHIFFGRLSGEEWGILAYKHLDHHLRQFGA